MIAKSGIINSILRILNSPANYLK